MGCDACPWDPTIVRPTVLAELGLMEQQEQSKQTQMLRSQTARAVEIS